VDGTSSSYPVQGLTIDWTTFTANVDGSTNCDGTGASGCSSSPLDAHGQYLTDVSFTNNTVNNLGRLTDNDTRLLNLRTATITGNLTVTGNKIGNPQTQGESLVDLYNAKVNQVVISQNKFTTVTNPDVLVDFNGATATTGLTLSNNQFVTVTNGDPIINLASATLPSFTMADNTFSDITASVASSIDFGASGATIGSFSITGNQFKNIAISESATTNGFIRLPYNKAITTSGLISNNTFQAGSVATNAIYWWGPNSATSTTSLTDSHVVIQDNSFDGWGDSTSTIRFYQTGAITARRNTFGASNGSLANTVQEEYNGNGDMSKNLVNNYNLTSNAKLNTWWPTARSASNTQTAAIQAVACVVPLEVAPPTASGNNAYSSARNPALPVTLDVYWTANSTAELYLGSYQLTSNDATALEIPLPMTADDPVLANLPAGSVVPVNPADGTVQGGLRLQTQDPNVGATAASSQYSRVAAIGGTCAPALALNQAAAG